VGAESYERQKKVMHWESARRRDPVGVPTLGRGICVKLEQLRNFLIFVLQVYEDKVVACSIWSLD
jgi:hypothetical protein